MSGPTSPCVRCVEATPMVGRYAYDEFGNLGEICPECAEAEL